MLGKELEMAKSSENSATHESKQSEGNLRDLEKLLKQKTWEMEDLKAMKEAKYDHFQSNLSTGHTSKSDTYTFIHIALSTRGSPT